MPVQTGDAPSSWVVPLLQPFAALLPLLPSLSRKTVPHVPGRRYRASYEKLTSAVPPEDLILEQDAATLQGTQQYPSNHQWRWWCSKLALEQPSQQTLQPNLQATSHATSHATSRATVRLALPLKQKPERQPRGQQQQLASLQSELGVGGFRLVLGKLKPVTCCRIHSPSLSIAFACSLIFSLALEEDMMIAEMIRTVLCRILV